MTNLLVCVNTSTIIHYHWYSHNENDKSSFDMPFSTPSVLRFFNFICWNSEHKIRIHSYSKKTQHRWRCSFAYICRQGNSLRSPTLPYKERNPRGVHSLPQPHTIRNNENHIGGNFSFKRESGAKRAFFMRIDEPHRGSAFDSPGLPSIASYPGLIC